ncbi:MAG: hypothetical protein LBS90_00180 [Oscillospiraceae bacterium]|jgi:type II secretory pathway pseudopilin PulG|nr:hypothetical protein [Oscillospiraceae bacterium]
MKSSKTGLFLIELIIALLLFAFCAALCIRIFFKAKTRTVQSEAISRSVHLATSAAEVFKTTDGQSLERLSAIFPDASFRGDGKSLFVDFTEAWEPVALKGGEEDPPAARYRMDILLQSDGIAVIEFFELPEIRAGEAPKIDDYLCQLTVRTVTSGG